MAMSTIKKLAFVLLPLLLVSFLSSQSVTELSKKEKERRAAVKGKPASVVTNADLAKVKRKPAVEVAEPEKTAAEAQASGETAAPPAQEGTQTPLETLERGSGSCRDFALLMMEAARRLGVATRFVSGYLYDPALDGGDDTGATVGAGYTHAWLQAYLPGAGWVPFDPTNNLLGGTQLIRVGVARDPAQAAPISGSWYGETGDYLGMDVTVTVQRE